MAQAQQHYGTKLVKNVDFRLFEQNPKKLIILPWETSSAQRKNQRLTRKKGVFQPKRKLNPAAIARNIPCLITASVLDHGVDGDVPPRRAFVPLPSRTPACRRYRDRTMTAACDRPSTPWTTTQRPTESSLPLRGTRIATDRDCNEDDNAVGGGEEEHRPDAPARPSHHGDAQGGRSAAKPQL